jgi:hypothetical protein
MTLQDELKEKINEVETLREQGTPAKQAVKKAGLNWSSYYRGRKELGIGKKRRQVRFKVKRGKRAKSAVMTFPIAPPQSQITLSIKDLAALCRELLGA